MSSAAMHEGWIIPNEQVAIFPAVLIDPPAIECMGIQELQHFPTLSFRLSLDTSHAQLIELKRPTTCHGMTPD
jgi:hypothetical protein